tara:strand:- start:866 stop:1696 length:831 start_codon:yes stop_codon:yes gene_type:complete
MKKKYAIIGNPISHSLSPMLHNYWFKKYNIDCEYEMMKVDPNNLKDVIEAIKSNKINGVNVTLPFKQKIIPYLNKIVNYAKETNSVNTVYLDDQNNVIGENTDVFGFQAGYLKNISNNRNLNKSVLVLGAGGVSPSIILALIKSNISKIYVANRTFDKALFLKKKFPQVEVLTWEEYPSKVNKFDIIVNATNLGLKGSSEFEILLDNVKDELIYIDTIYNPLQSKMIKHLKSKNIKTFNGLDMFIYQGQKSFYIWHKVNPEVDEELVSLLEKRLLS